MLEEDKYAVEYAPDGLHFQKTNSGDIKEMWDFFAKNLEIRKQLAINKFAKFRLRNLNSGFVLGVLPRAKG